MGETDRYQDYRRPKRSVFMLGDDCNALMALFTINVIFFLILMVMQVGYYFYEQTPEQFTSGVVHWFALPANLSTLSERPWTIITYMFSETGANIVRLISNMIWLWGFGYLLQQHAGNDKLIPIYLYSGVAGAVFFILMFNIMPASARFPEGGWLLGANAATMGVAAATTALAPDYRIFTQIRNGIPIWVLLGIYILIDIAGIADAGAPYSISHLAGAGAGFVFVLFLRKGKDGSIWMNRFYHWAMNLFNPNTKGNKTALKDQVFYKTGDRKPYTKTPNITQQRVDEILDKINQKGYNFLTDAEKEVLRKAAEDKDL